MKFISQLLPVDGEERHVVRGVAGHHQTLPAEAEIVWRGELWAALQGPAATIAGWLRQNKARSDVLPQEVPEGCVDEERPVPGAGDDEAQLGRDDDAGDGVLVASQDSSGSWDLRGNIIWRCLMARRGRKIN